jgi:hypothetical protein
MGVVGVVGDDPPCAAGAAAAGAAAAPSPPVPTTQRWPALRRVRPAHHAPPRVAPSPPVAHPSRPLPRPLSGNSGRSLGNLGSSKAWAQTGSMGGMLSQDCTVNPTFCNWNKVWMAYCDGNSFAGMADAPVMYNGTIPLNFRGRYNLDATFAAIAAGVMNPPTPWSAAYDIVLTGCSAGGLATYLHADYVANTYVAPSRPPPPGSNMTRNGRYFVLPISGFFLDAPNVNGEYVYTEQIKVIHYLSNATHGVNDACVAAQAPGKEYLCNMAPHV